ncbi:hypothetical protein [Dactylosporangium sp. NPDC000521]|uniref:hypothetical protein n=1 Tax=Dactylosporangium sp. NPDC000521 TaxID=3363975 RepID=UPI00368ED603
MDAPGRVVRAAGASSMPSARRGDDSGPDERPSDVDARHAGAAVRRGRNTAAPAATARTSSAVATAVLEAFVKGRWRVTANGGSCLLA